MDGIVGLKKMLITGGYLPFCETGRSGDDGSGYV